MMKGWNFRFGPGTGGIGPMHKLNIKFPKLPSFKSQGTGKNANRQSVFSLFDFTSTNNERNDAPSLPRHSQSARSSGASEPPGGDASDALKILGFLAILLFFAAAGPPSMWQVERPNDAGARTEPFLWEPEARSEQSSFVIKKYCTGDYLSYCGRHDPYSSETDTCFKKNWSRISENCRRAIDSYAPLAAPGRKLQ